MQHTKAWLALSLLPLLLAACHPWFETGPSAPDDQVPEITSPDGSQPGYLPGTPPWVPLIDACMTQGGSRGECIEALPAETLAALEAWERATAERRRTLLRERE